jgi:hypothetical protein
VFTDSNFRFKQDRPSKFCVVMAYQDNSPWRILGDIAASSNAAYCQKKGYGFRVFRSGWDLSRPHSWSKLHFILDTFQSYEWVFWIDADAVITNHNISLSSFITGNEDMVICQVQHLNEPERHKQILNCGVFLIRSCNFSKKLIETMWNKVHYINHPWWEQIAFIDAYNEQEDVRSRIRVMSARAFNSVPPWRHTMSNDAKWVPGDFVVHFSVYPIEVRIGMMRRLLAWIKEDDPFFSTTSELTDSVLIKSIMRGAGFVVGVDFPMLVNLLTHWEDRIYLVDSWKHIDGYRDTHNASDADLEVMCQYITRQCSLKPGLQVCRGDSVEIAKGIADECADWVFIDGPHSADRVLRDLEVWWPKVRIGGLLCGHDFIQDPNHPSACFEVRDAVTRFAASKFVSHRYSEAPETPSWAIRKTGIPVEEPIVLDRDGLPALFSHRRYKRGHITGDRIGGFVDRLAIDCFGMELSFSGDLKYPSREFERHTFDWVYLDSERNICDELEEWWDKVRPNGMICGHSMNPKDRIEIGELLAGMGLLATDTVFLEKRAWFLVKPKGDMS